MDCNKVQDMMSLYMDDQLSAEEKKLFEEHIASCEECKEELDFMQTIMSNVNDLNEEKELPADFHENLMVKIDSINSTSKQNSSKISRFNNFKRYYTAAAAVFVVVLIFGFIGISNLNHYKDTENYTSEKSADSVKEEFSKSTESKKESTTENTEKMKAMDQPKADLKQVKEDKKLENKDVGTTYGTAQSEPEETKASNNVEYDESIDDKAADTQNFQIQETKEEVKEETDTADTRMAADEPPRDNVIQNTESLDGNDVTVKFNEDVLTGEKENVQYTATGETTRGEQAVEEETDDQEENNNQWIIGIVILIALCLILLLLWIFKRLKRK